MGCPDTRFGIQRSITHTISNYLLSGGHNFRVIQGSPFLIVSHICVLIIYDHRTSRGQTLLVIHNKHSFPGIISFICVINVTSQLVSLQTLLPVKQCVCSFPFPQGSSYHVSSPQFKKSLRALNHIYSKSQSPQFVHLFINIYFWWSISCLLLQYQPVLLLLLVTYSSATFSSFFPPTILISFRLRISKLADCFLSWHSFPVSL